MSHRALLSLALAAAALLGCTESSPPRARGKQESAVADVPVRIVDLAGLDAALAEKKGRPLLVNFWAIWCAPCVEELPDLMEVARAHRADGAEVLGVSYDFMVPGVSRDEVEGKVKSFLAQRGFELPTLIYDGPDYDAINERFDLPGDVPVTLAIDASGTIVDRQNDPADAARFEEMMQKALGR
jgi:thiol-disulfide isomerase/thioredoxin